ncbi:exosome complex exonuclease Rrp41 [archaeon]|nr:exosome complex exonuclease Rrp41 [archaeon]|tara:strand:+ start:5046 stop:5753 length:708 start_codon:yes stop_codon:yes gene_type:complete
MIDKRPDGRKFEEMRKIEGKVGIVKRADGSAMFKIGDTVAIAAVHGPRVLHPRFLQDPQKGVLRCNYDMATFSVSDRKKPGPSRRSTEISLVTEKSLLPVLDLSMYPSSVIDVFIEITQANAGTRCAGIVAASMALAHAGIPMKDLVSAISVGKVGGRVVVDLDKEEEDLESFGGPTDIPIAYTPKNGEFTLLQLDGNITKEEFIEALKLGRESCKQIQKEQERALKEVYKEKGK